MELGLFKEKPMLLYYDKKSAINIAYNSVQHSLMKHIEIGRHFIKEKLDLRITCMSHVSSSDQLADICTKGLSKNVFSSLCSKMGLHNGLGGECCNT
jgi:hypothetical protein